MVEINNLQLAQLLFLKLTSTESAQVLIEVADVRVCAVIDAEAIVFHISATCSGGRWAHVRDHVEGDVLAAEQHRGGVAEGHVEIAHALDVAEARVREEQPHKIFIKTHLMIDTIVQVTTTYQDLLRTRARFILLRHTLW